VSTNQESTKDRILRVATALFAANGIKATTVAQIEEAVGLRKGSGGVHRHFETKDHLVRAILEDQFQRTTDTRVTAEAWSLEDSEHLTGHLERFGRYVLRESEQFRESMLIGFREGASLYERFPDLRQQSSLHTIRPLAQQIAALPGATDTDHDALAFLMLGPLLYHQAIKWLTNEGALEITDERLVEQWAAVFSPLLRNLTEHDQEN